MDYIEEKNIKFHKSFNEFLKSKENQRIVLMTTKVPYLILNLNLKKMIQFYLKRKCEF